LTVAVAVGAAVGVHDEGGCGGGHDGEGKSGGEGEAHVGGVGDYLDVVGI
jgi:hypothetical protein